MIKLITEIRKWKKDTQTNNIEISKLEVLAKDFDQKNALAWEKLKIKRNKSDLENEKLKIEIEKLKGNNFFKSSQGNVFRIPEIDYIKHWQNEGIVVLPNGKSINNPDDKYLVYLKSGAKLSLNKKEFNELTNQMEAKQ